ncbi:dihydrolipoamide acetyltransferase family protein [Sneathiella sp.]|uniref:dihydrolipoamide acetyltransferase family protein n=1 Tax=Sneathiella sp. TaxID=1964365 RepID=UPI00356171C7
MNMIIVHLPDVGEGVTNAEIVEWFVSVGDFVQEDDPIAAVMTDKATVEIPSISTGRITWIGAEIGDAVAVGAELVHIETKDAVKKGNNSSFSKPAVAVQQIIEVPSKEPLESTKMEPHTQPKHILRHGDKPLAAPAVRKRAQDACIDLQQVTGTGPAGRITHEDLDSFIAQSKAFEPKIGKVPASGGSDIKVVGMRRKIAEKMALSKTRIPHITLIEEIDVTSLETLRGDLNLSYNQDRCKLTILPFMIRAVVIAIAEQPQMNARYDDDTNTIHQINAVHVGIAVQMPAGLTVPVINHAEANSLWDNANEISRLSQAARDGKSSREELTGSTITITSLGPLGGFATTPIINYPEVAIIGVNKIAIRPMWDGQAFQPRKIMNISCAFDHRVIDGWDAAVFVQKLKTLLETPALMFIED